VGEGGAREIGLELALAEVRPAAGALPGFGARDEGREVDLSEPLEAKLGGTNQQIKRLVDALADGADLLSVKARSR